MAKYLVFNDERWPTLVVQKASPKEERNSRFAKEIPADLVLAWARASDALEDAEEAIRDYLNEE